MLDFDWRVDIKTSSDSVARMSVPTCILNLQIQKNPPHVNKSRETENVNVELSKETLDTMLDGLGKIRDQLASVANRWVVLCSRQVTMFCCWSPPVFTDSKPLVVDLNEVLYEKAWRNFRSTQGPCKKLALKRKNFVFEVPENYFDFEAVSQNIVPNKRIVMKEPGDKTTTNISSGVAGTEHGQNTDRAGLLKGKVPTNRELTNPEVVIVDTEFNNQTAQPQLYKFRFEKNRRTEIDVTFQKGFTLGGKANFSIGIPFGNAEVESELQYQVTKSEGQKFEESMVMEATSDIAVGPNSSYTANIQLEDQAIHANFKTVTRMSMPQGCAPVYIKRKSDGEKVFVFYVKNLVDTFKDDVPFAEIVMDDNGARVTDKLDFFIEGVVKGTLACSHKISLTSNESEELKNEAKIRYIKAIGERMQDH